MPWDKQAFAATVIERLLEIHAGQTTITDADIEAEADPAMREVLLGLLYLAEDLAHSRTALERSHAELESRVDARTTELRRANTDLELLASERLAAQEVVTRSLGEKEVLLKEIHHRVKNNLQIISSMLMLQSDRMATGEARSMLEESVHRVRSMALIHQQLYEVDSLARIDLGDYARSLSEALRSAYAPRARIEVRASSVEVTLQLAVPLGLILNELVTNACKYGLPRDGDGGSRPKGRGWDILVEVGVDATGSVRIAVTDSGPGLGGLDPTTTATLGFQLVSSLARQLRGKLLVGGDATGACFEVVCPRSPNAP